MYGVILVSICIAAASAAILDRGDCQPPDKNFHVESCLSQDDSIWKWDPSVVTINPYPPATSKPIAVNNIVIDNTNTSPYPSYKIVLSLEWYGRLFGRCGWHRDLLPAIAVNGCMLTHKCPVPTGKFNETINLDLTPYSKIIDKLAAGEYYKLTMKFRDDSGKDLSCAAASFLLAK